MDHFSRQLGPFPAGARTVSRVISKNTLLAQGYSQTYLKTVNNQLNAVFNYAVKYHDLKSNPCSKAGSMGKNKADKMNFWTKNEFMQFVDCVIDKQLSYVAFMTLYWTGVRIGELLALTPEDINIKEKTLSITKSYQRLDGRDIITPPKTPKSIRTIAIPEFLVADLQDYMDTMYEIGKNDRLFMVTKHYFEKEIRRGIKISGVKKIRIHDIRHSHCALLIEMGFIPLEIAERLGHERVETTMNTYGHLYPNKQRQLSNKLELAYREDL